MANLFFKLKKNVIDTETKSHQYAINYLDFGVIGKNQRRKRLSENFLIQTETLFTSVWSSGV
jgi:hypothetical protein